jgi:hypothetical protein
MRARMLLTGIALGATMLVGGAATAQAAPAHSQTSTTSTVAANGATASAAVPLSYVDIGTYRTLNACLADGEASIYSDWYCRKSTTTSNWHLWVNLNS